MWKKSYDVCKRKVTIFVRKRKVTIFVREKLQFFAPQKITILKNYVFYASKLRFYKLRFFEKYPGRLEISVFMRSVLECENFPGDQRQFLEARA
mgnify:CR=1 FL=1